MTTTPPETPVDDGPRVTRDEVRDLGRLRRSTTDRKVAGVAGGLARHLDVDPVLLRVAFVVLAFFGGAGLILYGACWALVPEDGSDRAAVQLDERSRTLALLGVGVLAALALVGDSWGAYWFPWPLVVIGLVVFVLLSRSGRQPAAPAEPAEGAAAAAGAAPVRSYPAYTAPPPDPRRRGPVLFWFTLALVAFAEGVLGTLDLAGLPVTDSAYPALAVGVVGVMLLVGSVVGRAGGLIALGLLASLVLAGATASDRWEGDDVRVHPTSAAAVPAGGWRIDAGELVVDLTDIRDIEALDGRTLSVTGDVGRLEVVVPDDVAVHAEARIHGPGGYRLFGATGGGIDTDATADAVAAPGAPTITVVADLQVGQISIVTE